MKKNEVLTEKDLTPELLYDLAIENQFGQFGYPEEFGLLPEIYLLFAKKDLKEESHHGDLNSVFNSKKAVHCQVDVILWNLGFSNYMRMQFPDKLKVLRDCGIIAPEILRKLNHMRNFLEHEYKNVKREAALDLFDIAHLFVKASNKYHLEIEFITYDYYDDEENSKVSEVELLKDKQRTRINKHLPAGNIRLDREDRKIYITYQYAFKNQLKEVKKGIDSKDYDEYCQWVRVLTKVDTLL